jgi:hypothetical protein
VGPQPETGVVGRSPFFQFEGLLTSAPTADLDGLDPGYGLRISSGLNVGSVWTNDHGICLEWTWHEATGSGGPIQLFSTGYLFRTRGWVGPQPRVEPVYIGGPAIGWLTEADGDEWVGVGGAIGIGLQSWGDEVGYGPTWMVSATYSGWFGDSGRYTGWGTLALSIAFHG